LTGWWELGLWLSLSLYLVSWFAALSRSSTSLRETLGAQGLKVAWTLQTLLLGLGVLWFSQWPQTLAPDLLNLTAWLCVGWLLIQGTQLLELMAQAVLRIFALVLLGISIAISHNHLPGLGFLDQGSWVHSGLLILHIVGFIAGYVLFGWACVASILFLYQEHQLKSKLVTLFQRRFPSLGSLERMGLRALRLGFASLSVGLILGAVLANSVRSGETSLRLTISLVAWVVYALMLINLQFQFTSRRWVRLWPIFGFLLILILVVLEVQHLTRPDLNPTLSVTQ
jgi:ABC-type uncharacterized transport system permease subunit